MVNPVLLDRHPLVFPVLSLTVAKVDSMGLVVLISHFTPLKTSKIAL